MGAFYDGRRFYTNQIAGEAKSMDNRCIEDMIPVGCLSMLGTSLCDDPAFVAAKFAAVPQATFVVHSTRGLREGGHRLGEAVPQPTTEREAMLSKQGVVW